MLCKEIYNDNGKIERINCVNSMYSIIMIIEPNRYQ